MKVIDLDHPRPLTSVELRQASAARKRGLRPEDLTELPSIPPHRRRRVYLRFQNPSEQPLNVRLDADVFRWLSSLGSGAQRKLNTLLRAAMRKD